MNNNTFKSVAFGGFDKQDVIRYIEQMAKEASEAQEVLQQENIRLQERVEATEERARDLEEQLCSALADRERLEAERNQLQESVSLERAAREALEPAQPEAARLAEELEKLRPDAEAYAQFREGLGAIECEARKRAADLESATAQTLEGTVSAFWERYQALLKNFDAVADHVTGELRKVEVSLAQLPRSMDQTEVELKELASVLEKTRKQEG